VKRPHNPPTFLRERPVAVNLLATNLRWLPPPPRLLPFLREQTQALSLISFLSAFLLTGIKRNQDTGTESDAQLSKRDTFTTRPDKGKTKHKGSQRTSRKKKEKHRLRLLKLAEQADAADSDAVAPAAKRDCTDSAANHRTQTEIVFPGRTEAPEGNGGTAATTRMVLLVRERQTWGMVVAGKARLMALRQHRGLQSGGAERAQMARARRSKRGRGTAP